MCHQQSFLGSIVVQLVELVIALAIRNTYSKMISGDGFKRMTLVNDQSVVIGKKRDAVPTKS